MTGPAATPYAGGMIVVLTEDGVDVREADDLRRLHLAVTGLTEDSAGALLRGAGFGELLDRETAVLDVAALRSQASERATADDWSDQWTAMIDYARTKGWLADDGSAVQVHVEWPVT